MRSAALIAFLCLTLTSCALRCHKEHTVVKGETLFSIASRYSLSETELREINRLRGEDRVTAGDWLFVPCEAVDGGVASGGTSKVASEDILKPAKPKKKSKKDYSKYQKAAKPKKKGSKASTPTPNGKGGANAHLIWPVKGEVARTFGQGGDAAAKGIDLRAGQGAGVKAAKGGTVRYVGQPASGAYGSMILIEHEGDLFTVYSQLGTSRVDNGQRVKKDEQLGTVGKEGYLHFEVRRGTKPVDPLLFLPPR